MHAGAYLIRLLEDQGVARIFTVPDESFLAALDGLHGSRTIETIICRQDAGAAMSAAATGRLTGRPGVALVAGGGGASCAAVGVHVARRDGAPMVLLVGLASPNVGDQPVIEPDAPTAAVGAMAKSFHILRSRSGLANLVAYAFHEALSGMPGPVVIGLPSDLLAGPAPDVAPNTADRGAPARAPAMAARTGLSEDVAFEIATRLAQAERPFIVIGGGGWSSRAAHRLQAFAELLNVPVATAPRRQDFIDNRSAVYAGHVGTGAPAGLVSALRDSDALLVIGAQASELAAAGILPINGRADGPALLQITATLGDAATSAQPVIQALCANQEAVDQLFLASQDLVAEAPALADPAHRVDRLRELHNAQVTARQPEPGPGTVQLGEVIRTVADTAPDAI
ncbi:MAG: thiamine pyrophosphate-binding protein, partial [Pseudomonadota bacterium]